MFWILGDVLHCEPAAHPIVCIDPWIFRIRRTLFPHILLAADFLDPVAHEVAGDAENSRRGRNVAA